MVEIFISLLSVVSLCLSGAYNLILNNQKLFLAFVMGCFGSIAYLAALYYRFVGLSPDELDVVLHPFKDLSRCLNKGQNEKMKNGRWWMVVLKCSGYAFIGGFIAVVFQWDVQNFVPVQDLIMGITWPTVVTQFLSGRLAGPKKDEMNEIRVAIDKIITPSNQLEELREMNEIRDTISSNVPRGLEDSSNQASDVTNQTSN